MKNDVVDILLSAYRLVSVIYTETMIEQHIRYNLIVFQIEYSHYFYMFLLAIV